MGANKSKERFDATSAAAIDYSSFSAPSSAKRTKFTSQIRTELALLPHSNPLAEVLKIEGIVELLMRRKSNSIGAMLLQLDAPIHAGADIAAGPPTFLSTFLKCIKQDLEARIASIVRGGLEDEFKLKAQIIKTILSAMIANVQRFGCDVSACSPHGTILHIIPSIKCENDAKDGEAIAQLILDLTRALLEQPKVEYRPPVNGRDEHGKTILHYLIRPPSWTLECFPMLQLLRSHALDINAISKIRESWWQQFQRPEYGMIELLLKWLLYEGDNISQIDFALVASCVPDAVSFANENPTNTCAEMMVVILRRLAQFHSPGDEASSSSSSSSSVSSSSPHESLREWLQHQLTSLPSRLPTARFLKQFSRLTNSNGQGFWQIFIADEEETQVVEELCVYIENQEAQATGSDASSSSSSSSPITPLSLLELDSSSKSLLYYLLHLPTTILSSIIPRYPVAQDWIIRQFNALSVEQFAHRPAKYLLGESYCERLIQWHRPTEKGDFIWLLYDSCFQRIFDLSSPLSIYPLPPLGKKIDPRQKYITISRGVHDIYRRVRELIPSDSYYPRFNREGRKKMSNYTLKQVKLILDLLEDYGANMLPEGCGIDFYEQFLQYCTAAELQEWITCTYNTTDTLWPSRPRDMSPITKRERYIGVSHRMSGMGENSSKALVKIFDEEAQRWTKEVWPKFEAALNEHLISDLSKLVLSYFTDVPPLSIELIGPEVDQRQRSWSDIL